MEERLQDKKQKIKMTKIVLSRKQNVHLESSTGVASFEINPRTKSDAST